MLELAYFVSLWGVAAVFFDWNESTFTRMPYSILVHS